MDPASVLHADNDLEWVDAPTPAPVSFHTPVPSTITNHNINDQLANVLLQISENLNHRSSELPKP